LAGIEIFEVEDKLNFFPPKYLLVEKFVFHFMFASWFFQDGFPFLTCQFFFFSHMNRI